MTTRKTVLFLIALVLLIVVIALQFAGPKQASATPMTEALAAKYDIPPFTVIRAGDLQLRSVPLEGAGLVYTQTTALEGMLTTKEVRAGNAVHSDDVIQAQERSLGSEALIYSFYVSTARVIGGQLRPGHYIDVLVTRPDTRDEAGSSMWLARGLWVVSARQGGGEEPARPTAAVYSNTQATPKPGGLFGGETALGGREGPANLVMVATHPEIAQMIGDYLGAKGYEPWVYIRPSGSVENMGRIDGVVFDDVAPWGVQTRNEMGIDRVSVTLFDEGGVAKATAQTSSGGKFHFDNLAPANYRVAVATPEGYDPATPQELGFYLADGQNQHLWFGAQKPVMQVVQVQATPEPAATPAPTTAAPAHEGAYALHMSNRESGPEMIGFPSGVAEVWAVVSFRDVAAGTPYTVKVQSTGAGGQERVVSTGTWAGGPGATSIRIAPWAGDVFADGTYITSLETGAEKTSRGFKSWTVGGRVSAAPRSNPPYTGPEEATPSPDTQR